MKFYNPATQEKVPADPRIGVVDCIPGEVYEVIFDAYFPSDKRPALSNLRLCVKDNGELKLFGLLHGALHAAKATTSIGRGNKLYLHRPDITLALED